MLTFHLQRDTYFDMLIVFFLPGMDEISLGRFLIKCPLLTTLVFPYENERTVLASEVLQSIEFEDKEDSDANRKTADFFCAYIKDIETRKEGKVLYN